MMQNMKRDDPTLATRLSDREILDRIVLRYNESPMIKDVTKWQMDAAEMDAAAAYALLVSPESQEIVQKHLGKFKWVDSGETFDT